MRPVLLALLLLGACALATSVHMSKEPTHKVSRLAVTHRSGAHLHAKHATVPSDPEDRYIAEVFGSVPTENSEDSDYKAQEESSEESADSESPKAPGHNNNVVTASKIQMPPFAPTLGPATPTPAQPAAASASKPSSVTVAVSGLGGSAPAVQVEEAEAAEESVAAENGAEESELAEVASPLDKLAMAASRRAAKQMREVESKHHHHASSMRMSTRQYKSCADECGGEHSIVKALKSGKKTPRCCVDLLYDTTTYVDRLLTRNGITYWAMKGTLLGVVREKGIIPHDYDIDIGMLFDDINKVASLRKQIWDDGYLLFQAPWSGYNNMNFVIAKLTHAIKKYLKRHPVKPDQKPRWNSEVRDLAVAAELMVFKKVEDQLLQVLCTWPASDDKNLYDGSVSKGLWEEYQKDLASYERRKKSEKPGWLKYANGQDKPFVNYQQKFDGKNRSKQCQRTAPASFRYEAPIDWVLPTKRLKYFSTTLSVPNDYHKYAENYFGKDYMTPKRRYG